MRVTQLKNIYNDINYWRKGGFDMGFDVGRIYLFNLTGVRFQQKLYLFF